MNRETYEALNALLKSRHVEDEAEDILLEIAEAMADMGKVNAPLSYRGRFGRLSVEASGFCEPGEDEAEEVSVFIKTLRAEGREFSIDEYLL